MPPIVIIWIVYGVTKNIAICESIGTNFEVPTFVVSPFRHLKMTSENSEKILIFPNRINNFLLIILNVRIWNDTMT